MFVFTAPICDEYASKSTNNESVEPSKSYL